MTPERMGLPKEGRPDVRWDLKKDVLKDIHRDYRKELSRLRGKQRAV
jgi:hypothetical protein